MDREQQPPEPVAFAHQADREIGDVERAHQPDQRARPAIAAPVLHPGLDRSDIGLDPAEFGDHVILREDRGARQQPDDCGGAVIACLGHGRRDRVLRPGEVLRLVRLVQHHQHAQEQRDQHQPGHDGAGWLEERADMKQQVEGKEELRGRERVVVRRDGDGAADEQQKGHDQQHGVLPPSCNALCSFADTHSGLVLRTGILRTDRAEGRAPLQGAVLQGRLPLGRGNSCQHQQSNH